MTGSMVFIDLRDGTGFPPFLQCVLTGDLVRDLFWYCWTGQNVDSNVIICVFPRPSATTP